MYKKFFMGLAAMAALTLVSCSSDDLNSLSDNSSKNEAISFDGYLGRSAVAVNGSRGSVLDKTALQNSTEGFGVFGNYSSTEDKKFGANLFNNQAVTYSSTSGTEQKKWTYTPLKYWSTQGHIDFLAYAPYNAGKVKDTYCLEFTVSPTITEQKDLLWAKAVGQTKNTISSTENKVKFKFDHALSRLGYTVKLKEDYKNVNIKLKKITLAGTDTDPKAPAFYTKGTIDLSTDQWSTLPTDAKQYFEWFSGEKPVTFVKPASEDKPVSNPTTDYLFVIPQDFSKGNKNNDNLYVIVEYTIQNGTTETMTSTVSSKIEDNFEQGKAYTINLTIGLTPIDFDVEVVNGWVDDNTIPEIPLN